LPLVGSEKHAAQHPEKLRKTPSLNYKSAALFSRVTGRECSDSLLFGGSRGVGIAAAALYRPFSALNILAEK